ncbi:CASP8 and FADD-like apoptosis regulator a [Megalops cyprinoides]|uniref:CASP8 and FADD-like apoptosis regulator a n=1 Tax=Megalops cyprinoides TaxID=118141 RepID=UPI0018642DC4|nr:CASP8 and FADD-like apoptosis regulator a [Megalops cyprinoides]XP_036400602.1 CASP8 and FADD-like apoptosis regulator a [Megalops cyprinoides]
MADGQLSQTINDIAEDLSSEDCKRLVYLCSDLHGDRCVEDVRGMLRALLSSGDLDHVILLELMLRIKRYDILKRVLRTDKRQAEGILQNGCVVSEYRVLMADLSEDMGKEDLQSLIFLLSDTLPRGRLEKATSFLDVVVELEKLEQVSSEKVDLIEQYLWAIRRVDLAKKVQRYQSKGKGSQPGTSVPRPMEKKQCLPKIQPRTTLLPTPVSRTGSHHRPKPQAPENLKLAVPETGRQCCQGPVEAYPMQTEPRGVCVIIDCVGSDGDMLEQTFSRLRFSVTLRKWLGVVEMQSVLTEVSCCSQLQRGDAFVCCLLSRARGAELLGTELLGTETQLPGLRLDALRHLFTPQACPALAGKPKLFFLQSYSVADLPGPCGVRDEDLETDGPATACVAMETVPTETVPTDADVFWSQCRTEERQLGRGGHQSVYLRALCAALLNGHKRKRHLVDVHTEVNGVVYEHNQRQPGETYSMQLRHTLRKLLFL